MVACRVRRYLLRIKAMMDKKEAEAALAAAEAIA